MHKTIKVQCQNKFVTAEFMIAKQFQYITTSACSCCILSAKHTHGTVPAGWQSCFCLCKAVHLWAVNALRILSELPEWLGPSRKVHNQTVYS